MFLPLRITLIHSKQSPTLESLIEIVKGARVPSSQSPPPCLWRASNFRFNFVWHKRKRREAEKENLRGNNEKEAAPDKCWSQFRQRAILLGKVVLFSAFLSISLCLCLPLPVLFSLIPKVGEVGRCLPKTIYCNETPGTCYLSMSDSDELREISTFNLSLHVFQSCGRLQVTNSFFLCPFWIIDVFFPRLLPAPSQTTRPPHTTTTV